jgi:membrane protease YdiL (CAAX protease family)
VVLSLALAIPAWFAAQDVLDEMMHEPGGLLDRAGLSGGLIGYVLLAFAGVGWMVRLDLRGAAARLGLRVPKLSDIAVAAVAVGALWVLNSGGEWIQHRWFPASFEADHRMSDAIAAGMGPARVLLLGLSAGIGEEITMRGALQPRLGIPLTSLMFASLHVQYSWFGLLVIFVLGGILGLVRARASTTAAILAHSTYDVLAVLIR